MVLSLFSTAIRRSPMKLRLFALLALSGVVALETRNYFRRWRESPLL